jgi:hypothetical protein
MLLTFHLAWLKNLSILDDMQAQFYFCIILKKFKFYKYYDLKIL